ncbi:MAG: nitroreductase family deazaflavin-dependent oxidoreductase [Sporichthyaceae bacterium]
MGATDVVKDTLVKTVSKAHTFLFRRSSGRLGAKFRKAPTLLLTTTGRKSGKQHTVPLLYLADGETLVVVGSYAGDDRTPAWFLNLIANPAVEVERDARKVPMTAVLGSAEDKARLWPALVKMYPSYAAYQKKTSRDIPIALLRAT